MKTLERSGVASCLTVKKKRIRTNCLDSLPGKEAGIFRYKTGPCGREFLRWVQDHSRKPACAGSLSGMPGGRQDVRLWRAAVAVPLRLTESGDVPLSSGNEVGVAVFPCTETLFRGRRIFVLYNSASPKTGKDFFMSAPDELGDEFVSKKVLQALGIDVPEDALGFYVKDKTLYIEAMQTGDDPGPLMIMVDTVEVPLSDEQVQRLKDGGFYSSKGFRLG